MTNDLVQAYKDRTDDELYELLGEGLLGVGLGVSPGDRDRFRRFAKAWLANKAQQLRRRVLDSDTYRIWVQTAGTGQAIEPDIMADILRGQGEDDETAAVLAVLLDRAEQAESAQTYDIAVSFADERRDYVEATVVAAKSLNLHVFYDRDMTHQWWGRNFVAELRKVYGQRALHFVPFISTEYLTKPYPRDEFSYAMITSVERGGDYILPVLIGDVLVPPELLHPHIHCLHAEDHTPAQLADTLRSRVDSTRAAGRPPRDIGAIVHEAHRTQPQDPR
jgi:hypothetical protein